MMFVKIWSREHSAWWRHEGMGYTSDELYAGWFDVSEGLKILLKSSYGSQGKPNEYMKDQYGNRFYLTMERAEALAKRPLLDARRVLACRRIAYKVRSKCDEAWAGLGPMQITCDLVTR